DEELPGAACEARAPDAEHHDADRRQEGEQRQADRGGAPRLPRELHLALRAPARLAQRALLGREQGRVAIGVARLPEAVVAPAPRMSLSHRRPSYAPARRGSVTTNSVPCGAAARTSIEPPCACTTLRASARPSPVPPCFEVVKGSKRRGRSSGAMPGPLSRTRSQTSLPARFSPASTRTRGSGVAAPSSASRALAT